MAADLGYVALAFYASLVTYSAIRSQQRHDRWLAEVNAAADQLLKRCDRLQERLEREGHDA